MPTLQQTGGANYPAGKWLDNGVTVERKTFQQQAIVSNWAGNPVIVPFRAISTIGYVHEIQIWLPPATTYGTVTLAGGTASALGITQLGPLRMIQRFQLALQGMSALWNVTGDGLAFIQYCRGGNWNQTISSQVPSVGVYQATLSNGTFPYQYPGTTLGQVSAGATNASVAGYGNQANTSGVTATAVGLGLWVRIPITEWVTFRDEEVTVLQNGNILADKAMEIGMIPLQNKTQWVIPTLTLNPLYSLDNNAPFIVTGAATVAATNLPFGLSYEYYDVPVPDTQKPPDFAMRLGCSHTDVTVTVSGGAASYVLANAGLLYRLIIAGYHDGSAPTNGVLVDLTNSANNLSTIVFQWGANIQKVNERGFENANRSLYFYGTPPPGIYVLDFFKNGVDTDMVNTVALPQPTLKITGLDQSATGPTRLYVIEERLIPVDVAPSQ